MIKYLFLSNDELYILTSRDSSYEIKSTRASLEDSLTKPNFSATDKAISLLSPVTILQSISAFYNYSINSLVLGLISF